MNIKRFAALMLALCILTGIVAQPPQSAAASAEAIEDSAVSAQELKMASAATGSAAQKSSKSTKTTKTTAKTKTTKAATKKNYSKAELRLMASIINCEAGIESYQGKVAVGVVVMNRVKSKQFPNTIKKVIYEKGQFSPVRNGALKKRLSQYDAGKTGTKQWKSCIKAAKAVLNGQRTIIYKGKVKNMSSFYFFSVYLPKARLKLGGHRFK